jgi:hypothetical protein
MGPTEDWHKESNRCFLLRNAPARNIRDIILLDLKFYHAKGESFNNCFKIVCCATVLNTDTVLSNYWVFFAFQFNCSDIESLPDVTLVIGGRNFNISAEYHVQQQVSCYYFHHTAIPNIPVTLIVPYRSISSWYPTVLRSDSRGSAFVYSNSENGVNFVLYFFDLTDYADMLAQKKTLEIQHLDRLRKQFQRKC